MAEVELAMTTIESAQPLPELRICVRAYAERTLDLRDSLLHVRVPARLEQILEFQFEDSFQVHFEGGGAVTTPRVAIIGPQTRFRASIEFHGRIHSFAIFFQPSGISSLFGLPMNLFADSSPDAHLLGPQSRALWNELGEAGSFRNRVAIADRFLCAALRRRPKVDRMMQASDALLALQGRTNIAEFARHYGMSQRHFERTFRAHVGVPPKTYARIARFQTALDLKIASPRISWLEISHALGYYDQMHLIHDFRKLGGNSPERVLDHLGDMRPEALASCRP